MPLNIQVRGLVETQRKLQQVAEDLHGKPMSDAMGRATILVMSAARMNAPVDTGQLRASITPEVRTEGWNVIGIVGSNKVYAPFMELGTRPHMPPLAALATWARRHNTSAFLVARAIARRGLKARKYLQRAVDDNRARIEDIIGDAVTRIVRR